MPLSVKVTPPGRAPVLERAAFGKPVEVTLKVPVLPIVKLALFALVIDGACLTVRVKLWVAFGLMPLLAVMVIG